MQIGRLIFLPLLLVAAAPVSAGEPYWQCAAFARQFSGIGIRGDAWTWWGQAEGRYAKGSQPRIGAVMSFVPTGPMQLGHVATVTQVLGARELTITHANWSPINGTRGQIERDVLVRDVSDNNDWSRVRVWYAPIDNLGATAWPIDGFIYARAVRADEPARLQVASATVPRASGLRSGFKIDFLDRATTKPQRRALIGSDVIRLATLEARFRP